MALTTKRFAVQGMHCGSCAMNVDMTLEDVAGVQDVKTDLASEATTVMFDDALVTTDDLASEIGTCGYTATLA
jgi:copper chaperone